VQHVLMCGCRSGSAAPSRGAACRSWGGADADLRLHRERLTTHAARTLRRGVVRGTNQLAVVEDLVHVQIEDARGFDRGFNLRAIHRLLARWRAEVAGDVREHGAVQPLEALRLGVLTRLVVLSVVDPDVVELVVSPVVPVVDVRSPGAVELEVVCEPDVVEPSTEVVVVVGSTDVSLPEGEKHPLSSKAAAVNLRGSMVDALTVPER
jgi:hypothetical protein